MLPKVIRSHVLPFESLIVQSYPQMQFSLMEQLHEQEFTFLLVDVLLDVMQTHLCPCVGPVVGVWLLVHLNTLSFCFSFIHFLTTLHIFFSIPHPISVHLSKCQCGHTINDLGIDLLRCQCGSENIVAHDML